MAACVVACITQSDINLNNNFLCFFPVLFSLPSPSLHVSSDTCSCGATSPTPSPRVNLCCPAPSGLPIYPTYTLPIKPAAVSNLSVSSIFSFLLLLFTWLQRYTQPSAPCTLSTTFISPMFTLIYGLTPSLFKRVCVRVQACLRRNVWV